MVAFSGVLNRWFLPVSDSQLLFLRLHFQSVIKACQFGLQCFWKLFLTPRSHCNDFFIFSHLSHYKNLLNGFYSPRRIPVLALSISCWWKLSKPQTCSSPFLPWRHMLTLQGLQDKWRLLAQHLPSTYDNLKRVSLFIHLLPWFHKLFFPRHLDILWSMQCIVSCLCLNWALCIEFILPLLS